MASQTTPSAKKSPIKKVPLSTSFDNQNDNSVFKRLMKYSADKGFEKPQDVVRLAVSKFLDKEDY